MDESLFSDQPAPDAHLFSDKPAPTPESMKQDMGFVPQSGSALPEPQVSDNPPAGAEVPFEQRLANNAIAAGNGAALPGGIASLGKLAARGAGAALNAIPATKNIVPAIGDMADEALLKSLGTMGGQVKSSGGIEAARDAAQVGRKAGLDDILSTERGRMDALKNLTSSEGAKIGALRNQAGTASPGILDQVAAELEKKYNPANPDLLSSQYPKVKESLGTIKNVIKNIPSGPPEPQTNAQIAKGVTNLNNIATGEKLRQPTNAMTDVANKVSKLNNADIMAKLGPKGAKAYQDALHNEAGAFHLAPYMEKGNIREATSRGGGKGMLQTLAQKIADAGGYRATSKGLNTLQQGMNTPMTRPPTDLGSLAAYLAAQKDKDINDNGQ